MSYYREVYLKSDDWKQIKSVKESRRSKRCAICLSTVQIDLHHLFYRRDLAQTQSSDLRWLCRRCHSKAHELIDKGVIKIQPQWSHHAIFASTKSKVKQALRLAKIRIDKNSDAVKAIDALRTAKGGYTKETIMALGVPWPPPKGWRKQIIRTELSKQFA